MAKIRFRLTRYNRLHASRPATPHKGSQRVFSSVLVGGGLTSVTHAQVRELLENLDEGRREVQAGAGEHGVGE